MTQPGGNMTNYLVQFNTGSGYTGTNLFGPFKAQGVTNNISWDGLTGAVGGNGNAISMRMLDINGDGLPDRVMLIKSTTSSGTATPQNQTYLVVELNNGYGFEPAINWTNVNPYYNVSCGGGSTPGISDLGDDAYVAYRDVNGDGLPDRIIACQCSPYTTWMVQINTGTGFGPLINWGPVNSQGQTTTPAYCGIQTTTTNGLIVNGVSMLLDMNGDGLPDRVEVRLSGIRNLLCRGTQQRAFSRPDDRGQQRAWRHRQHDVQARNPMGQPRGDQCFTRAIFNAVPALHGFIGFRERRDQLQRHHNV